MYISADIGIFYLGSNIVCHIMQHIFQVVLLLTGAVFGKIKLNRLDKPRMNFSIPAKSFSLV